MIILVGGGKSYNTPIPLFAHNYVFIYIFMYIYLYNMHIHGNQVNLGEIQNAHLYYKAG